MNSKDHHLTQKIIYVTLGAILLLLIPFIAMQFTQEVAWSPGDFLIAGILLLGTGVSFVLITLRSELFIYRLAIGITLFSMLFLVWSNLAVGIIGAEDNPINLWYFGVVLIGVIGMLLSRFKPTGMAYTLFSMITGIIVITITALIQGMQTAPVSPLFEIIGVNLLFVILFGSGGSLFLYSARKTSQDL